MLALGCTAPNPAYDPHVQGDGGRDGPTTPAMADGDRRPAADGPSIAPDTVGSGLRGDYFDGVALEAGDTGSLDLRRVDATIDFDWGYGRPSSSVDDDWFSVRWTGQVMPQFSETYTFSTVTDDGVRLWIDGVLLIDQWTNQESTMRSGTVRLVANRKHDIRMEYYEATQQAVARLYWSSISQRQEIIPRARLFPPP